MTDHIEKNRRQIYCEDGAQESSSIKYMICGTHSALWPWVPQIIYMGQIPQDGENEQYVALFLIFEALL